MLWIDWAIAALYVFVTLAYGALFVIIYGQLLKLQETARQMHSLLQRWYPPVTQTWKEVRNREDQAR